MDGLGREAVGLNEHKTGCMGTEGQEKMRGSQNLGHRSPSMRRLPSQNTSQGSIHVYRVVTLGLLIYLDLTKKNVEGFQKTP